VAVAFFLLQEGFDPSKFTEVIKAVTDPYSLLALIVLVLGSLGYQALRKEENSGPRIACLLIIVFALLALGLNATKVINTNKAAVIQPQSQASALTVNIVFRGSHVRTQPLAVPFQVGSGQVNFGCGESAHPVVTFNVPLGAREINATARWVNTDNVKGQDQRTAVAGASATAYGTIVGLDRDWIGNCHGGGHGELVLSGTYVIEQPSATEPVTKTISTTMMPGSEKTFELPSQTDQTPNQCEITAASDKGVYGRIVLNLRSEGTQITSQVVEQSGKAQASVQNGALVVRLE
jgi:hypothetical protein